MKKSKASESESYLRSNTISLITWAITNNSMVSPLVYLVFMLFDFALQLMLIICIYSNFKAVSFSSSQLEKIIELHDYGTANLIQVIMVLTICVGVVTSFVVLIIRRANQSIYSEKHIFFKTMSMVLVALRTFLFTYFTIVLACNFMPSSESNPTSSQLKYVQIALASSAFIFLIIITYVQSQMFNLTVPNKYLPWSETLSYPFIIQCLFKMNLSLAFNFRNQQTVCYVLLGLCLVSLFYNILSRIRHTYIFNIVIFNFKIFQDTVLFHAIIFLLPAKLVNSPLYYAFPLATLPISLLFTQFAINRFKVTWTVDNIDKEMKDKSRLVNFFQLLEFFIKYDDQTKTFLYQIQYFHYLKCHNFGKGIDKKLQKKKGKILDLQSEKYEIVSNHPMTISSMNVSMTGIKTGNNQDDGDQSYAYQPLKLNVIEEEKEDPIRQKVKFLGLTEKKQLADIESSLAQLEPIVNKRISRRMTIAQFVNKRLKKDNVEEIKKKAPPKPKKIVQKEEDKKAEKIQNQKIQEEYEFDKNGYRKREKEIKRLLKHFFKHHLIDESTKDYRIHLLKAYFTIKILKNHFLGHFLIFDFANKSKKDSLFLRNQKLFHQKFFEEMISTKNSSNDQMKMIDLQNMLDLNQMYAKFETLLEIIGESTLKFWQGLYQEKDAITTYQKGIDIAQTITQLQKLYQSIEAKQGDKKEVKMYIQMAAFYRYAVFKSQDYLTEMQKSQNIFQMRKISNEKFEREVSEKGLILVNIDLKKPMEIQFINKQACNIVQFEKKQAVGLVINNIMPQIIAENHHKFVEQFMKTGKHGMINQKRRFMIKRGNGHIAPVNTFLFVNNINLSTMILLIDQQLDDFKPFEDVEDYHGYGVMICDRDLKVFEISSSCSSVCKLSHALLDLYQQQNSRDAYLDDLFQNMTSNQDFLTAISQGYQDLDVTIKYQDLLEIRAQNIQEYDDFRKDQDFIEENKSHEKKTISKTPSNHYLSVSQLGRPINSKSKIQSTLQSFINPDKDSLIHILSQTTFTMKFAQETLLNKNIEIKYVYIKMQYSPNQILYSQAGVMTNFTNTLTQDPSRIKSQIMDARSTIDLSAEFKNEMTMSQDMAGVDMPEEFLDLSSQASSSSTISNLLRKYDFQDNTSKSKLPTTLKIVIQIVLLVFFIVFATSTISLVLVQSNFSDAIDSISMSNLSIERLNCISQIRVMMRVLVNIQLDYNDPSNTVLVDRFSFYEQLSLDKLEVLRQQQIKLDQKDNEVSLMIGDVYLQYLTSAASFYYENRSISEAVNLYINNGNEIINYTDTYGANVLNSRLVYFWIPIEDIHKATVTERDLYFIIQNSNQDLYNSLDNFATLYTQIKQSKIQSKVKFSTTMTWICVGIIFLSGLLIIPLFGKIQTRIQNLMGIFFSIKKELKQTFIDKLEKFQGFIDSKEKQIQKERQAANQKAGIVARKSTYVKKDIEPLKNRLSSASGKLKVAGHSKNSIMSKFAGHQVPHAALEDIKIDQNKEHIEEQKSEDDDQVNLKDHSEKQKRKEEQRKLQQKEAALKPELLAMNLNFQKAIQKKKIIQSIAIIILLLGFQSYFIGTYFMSSKSFTEMSDSIDIIFILFERKSCGESVIHSIIEGYQWNDTYYINNGQDEIMDYFTKRCFKLEGDYQNKVRKAQPSFLGSSLTYLNFLEAGNFCDDVFQDGDGFQQLIVTPEKCKTFAGGISQNGLTNVYQTIYQVCQQLQIEYQTAFDTGGDRGGDFLFSRMKLAGNYLDVLETILSKPQQLLTQKVLQSLFDYFNIQSRNFIIVYSIFTMLTFLLLLFFFCKIFSRLKKEMLLSNKLLYVIDFEAISDLDRSNINKFLTKF